MGKKHKMLGMAAAGFGIVFLILDSKNVMESGKNGIEFCLTCLLPSMFPLMVLCTYLAAVLRGYRSNYISAEAGSVLCGLLGGYPVGAICVNTMRECKSVTRTQAGTLLPICNNAGPAFIFGVCGRFFSAPESPWILWGAQAASAAFCYQLLYKSKTTSLPAENYESPGFLQTVKTASVNMALICAWVILFRILIGFMERWLLWMLPTTAQIIISGVVELSNGCYMLVKIKNEELRLIICTALLSLGGLCVMLQTYSAARSVSKRKYVSIKMLQCTVGVAVAWMLYRGLYWIVAAAYLALFFIKKQKLANRGRNSRLIHV